MVRLRIALGVASSLVAVAALTIVFAGTGQAQGNGGGPNVTVVNTPLPVSGNVTATMTGSVNAVVTGAVTVNNPSNNPVLIRDVDAKSPKQLWQTNKNITIADGDGFGQIVFDPVPAGKTLVVEHVNILFQNSSDLTKGVWSFSMNNTSSFSALAPSDIQYFVPQSLGIGFTADAATKFFVGSGNNVRISMLRVALNGTAFATATVTGYFVDNP